MEDEETQFHIIHNQLPPITLAEAYSQDATEMQGQVMWHQTQDLWPQSFHQVHDPYMGYPIHTVPNRLSVSQYRCRAPYWLSQNKLHPDRHPTHWWPEAFSVASQAERSCSHRHRLMNVSMWPGLTARPHPLVHSFRPQAGDSTCLSAWQQAAGPLLRSPGPEPAVLSQVSETHLQGETDSWLPISTSLEEAMKIFQCEPVPKQASPVEAGIPLQRLGSIPTHVSDEAPSHFTVDQTLDHEDLVACVQQLLDGHISTEAQDHSVGAEEPGMEFDYEMDSLGRLCDP